MKIMSRRNGGISVNESAGRIDYPTANYSPVKLSEDPKQIATQILFAFLTILDLYCKHANSIPKSENMKFDFLIINVIVAYQGNAVYYSVYYIPFFNNIFKNTKEDLLN